MTNKRNASSSLPDEIELLGDGLAYHDTICTMLLDAKGFEIFHRDEIRYLAKHMNAYHVRAGATIFREGDSNSYLAILIQGRVCVYKEDSEHRTKLLSVISPGRVFGEISVIDAFPYSASIVAESKATLLLMSRENFWQCVEDKPAMGIRMLSLVSRLLCARLRASSGQLVDYIDV